MQFLLRRRHITFTHDICIVFYVGNSACVVLMFVGVGRRGDLDMIHKEKESHLVTCMCMHFLANLFKGIS